AADALRERLGRNVLPAFPTELEVVDALGPTHVIQDLIGIDNRGLRRNGVGPDLRVQILIDLDVREHIQSRELEVTGRNVVVIAVESKTELVQQGGREVMKFRKGGELVSRGAA